MPIKKVDSTTDIGLGGCKSTFLPNNFPFILHYVFIHCMKSLKIQLYLVLSGLGLGGANAPLHPPWLRYWLLQ